jgi:hypothetical protein
MSHPTDAPVGQGSYLWRQYSLLTDSRLLYELLAKDNSLVAPLQAFLDNGPRLSDDGAGHHEALVAKCGCTESVPVSHALRKGSLT